MSRIFTYLVVDAPGVPQKIVLWDTLDISVGRGADQDLTVEDAEVSRHHAIFQLEGQSFTVADLHTSNGTFVNGTRIDRQVLRPGDGVQLGGVSILFRQEAESPMRAGVDACFASQLKGFGVGLEESGGRTVLGVAPGGLAMEPGEDFSALGPAHEMQLDFDGNELHPPGGDLLDAELDLADLSVPAPLELPGFDDDEIVSPDKDDLPLAELPVVDAMNTPPPQPAPRRAPGPAPGPRREAPAQARTAVRAPAPVSAPATTDERRVAATLSVEIEGPRSALRAVLAALLDQELDLPPLKVRIRRPGR